MRFREPHGGQSRNGSNVGVANSTQAINLRNECYSKIQPCSTMAMNVLSKSLTSSSASAADDAFRFPAEEETDNREPAEEEMDAERDCLLRRESGVARPKELRRGLVANEKWNNYCQKPQKRGPVCAAISAHALQMRKPNRAKNLRKDVGNQSNLVALRGYQGERSLFRTKAHDRKIEKNRRIPWIARFRKSVLDADSSQ